MPAAASESVHRDKRRVPHEIAWSRAFAADPNSGRDYVWLCNHADLECSCLVRTALQGRLRTSWVRCRKRRREVRRPRRGLPNKHSSRPSMRQCSWEADQSIDVLLTNEARTRQPRADGDPRWVQLGDPYTGDPRYVLVACGLSHFAEDGPEIYQSERLSAVQASATSNFA